VLSHLEEAEVKQKESIKNLAKDITDSFSDGFTNLKDSFNLNKGQTDKLKDSVNTAIEDIINEKSLTLSNQVKELEKEYEIKKQEADTVKDESLLKAVTQQYEKEKKEIEESFIEEINKDVENTINTVVEEQIEKVEEKKKKTTEDDVRDHLRGFARTIPAFLMAYGDDNTKLANFEENIDADTFEDLTSITINEFKQLRDGFEYIDDKGETKVISGLFNEVVFNASIQEFLDTKKRLANYFDDSLQEDIFDYIPPQKTNQIFTPKRVVKKMINILEEENPGIFSDKTLKFADLYVKSGLYITEIVKKLNDGLKGQIPNQQDRIKWILENQVYACAPSDIIYNIVKNFIFNELEYVSSENLKLADTAQLASDEVLASNINGVYGDDNLKFDVIIGNPPYQNEGIGEVARDEPIYNKFMEESYKIADNVSFVTPARFLFNAGQTPKRWNEKMLSDEHLKVVYYEQNSAKIFPNTDIKGGIAITYRDANKNFGAIGTFTHLEELNSILSKVLNDEFSSFNEILYGKSSYKFTPKIYEENPELKGRVSVNEEKSIGSNIFDKLPEIFFDVKQSKNQIQILGRKDGSRIFKWINKDVSSPFSVINTYPRNKLA
ncbi:MAG TPA: Eco57I restriction-modification methylase domain-containing protein, partial [Niallia sp.]|nr:Eco57I restriction-modification methylase domain-containing protein [Niallia sp.]